MKTSELTGNLLAKWVAKAAGICLHDAPHTKSCGNWGTDYTCTSCGKDAYEGPTMLSWAPHENWAQGGPIIERERIELIHYGDNGAVGAPWEAQISKGAHYIDQYPHDATGGPTPLIAAMRAYVASKFGDEVPDEVPA